jgi:rhodanese-related sulfurtransferase
VKLWRLVAIFLTGCVLGLGWNSLSGKGLPLTRNAYLKEGDEVIKAAEAKRRFDGGALFVDARDPFSYRYGHIPGALSLPEGSFDQVFPKLERQLRARFDIVVYCSGFGCEASHIVSRQLKAVGVPAAVFADGIPAWLDAGYPTRKGETP